MTETANIYTALVAAQSQFGAVTKGATNPAFKSKYADLSDVASVVIPALSAQGVAVLHYLTGESLGVMRTEFIHAASETKVHCDIPLIVDRQNMQGMKSATTYAKRIGLESLSGVAPEDDDGNDASKAPPPKKEKPVELPPEAIDAAKTSLGNADTLDQLRDIFTGLPKPVASHPDVVTAKDAAKKRLTPKLERQPDSADDDEIPM